MLKNYNKYVSKSLKTIKLYNTIPGGRKLQVKDHYLENHTPVMLLEKDEFPKSPYTNTKLVEDIKIDEHLVPKTFGDKIAYYTMLFLRQVVHLVFRDRYSHHAVVLETVAAVPPMIAGVLRHFTSLRRMHRDYGWISTLLEEAENERMHLLVWMQYVSPTFFERIIVIIAQALFIPFYTFFYILSPKTAHRMVGYLEEEAVRQYTYFLNAIDAGKIKNLPAADIAKKSPDATLRDVVLVVRADEAHHRDVNHEHADKVVQSIQ